MTFTLIITAGILVLGIALICNPTTKTAGRVILTILTGIVLSVVGAVAFFVMLFFKNPVVWIGLLIFVSAALTATLVTTIWGGMKRKGVRIPVLSVLALSLVCTGAYTAYQLHIDSLPTLTEGSYSVVSDYKMDDENSKIAKLDEPATFSMKGSVVKLDGATALYPVYASFAKATGLNPDKVKCTTTGQAYKAMITGDVDIIFVAAPSEKQMQEAKENGVELVFTPIGKEAFVFLVNSKNNVDSLTSDQIRGIYSGKITQWSEVGGKKSLGAIRPFQREEGSGSQSAIQSFMGDVPLMEPETENVMSAMDGMITKTANYKNYKNALGYSFRFYSTEMVTSNQIKLLAVDGVAPTRENIENDTYPITSEFYAVTRSDANQEVKGFLDWILGEQGQSLIEKTGYTSIN